MVKANNDRTDGVTRNRIKMKKDPNSWPIRLSKMIKYATSSANDQFLPTYWTCSVAVFTNLNYL